jgi:NAD(P)-dependent dehydrogenase (short-subunit alcohol dehydrogenase family)
MKGVGGLRGRVGVVTGGGSGLGKALAEGFASAGGKVLVADLDFESAVRVCTAITGRGGDATPAAVDVADCGSVERLADICFDTFGRCDVLINNAGIADFGPALSMPLDRWRRIIDVNLMGIVHGVRAFAPRMAAAKEISHVVNIASMAGLVPLPGFAAYVASKSAVVGLSEVLREELAPSGVVVSVACPGWIATAIQPASGSGEAPRFRPELSRVLQPEAAAAIILNQALASDLYILTHPEWQEEVRTRFAALVAPVIVEKS